MGPLAGLGKSLARRTLVQEVTPGSGTSISFARRAVEANQKLITMDLMARGRLQDCAIVVQTLETYESVSTATFSPDCRFLLYGHFSLRLVNIFTGSVTELLPLGLGLPHREGVASEQLRCGCFSADSELCAAARGADLVCFDVTTQAELCCLRGADEPIVACLMAPRAGARIAAAMTESAVIYLWRDVGVHGALPPLRINASSSSSVGLPSTATDTICNHLVLVHDASDGEAHVLAGGRHGVFRCWPLPEEKWDGLGVPQRLGDAVDVTFLAPCFPRKPRRYGPDASALSAALADAPLQSASLPPLIAGAAGGAGASGESPLDWGGSRGGGALVLCAQSSGDVHVRDSITGASLHRIPTHVPSTGMRACAVGAGSAQTLLTLAGFHDAVLHDALSGRRLAPPALGPSLGLTGWISRVAACALAPDDSALLGLSVSRHGSTGLFLVRLEDAVEVEHTDCL